MPRALKLLNALEVTWESCLLPKHFTFQAGMGLQYKGNCAAQGCQCWSTDKPWNSAQDTEESSPVSARLRICSCHMAREDLDEQEFQEPLQERLSTVGALQRLWRGSFVSPHQKEELRVRQDPPGSPWASICSTRSVIRSRSRTHSSSDCWGDRTGRSGAASTAQGSQSTFCTQQTPALGQPAQGWSQEPALGSIWNLLWSQVLPASLLCRQSAQSFPISRSVHLC